MTQEDLILEHLQSGRSISSLEALSLFQCFRLASRISDIRKKYPDINIDVKMIHSDGGKHYASYRLLAKEDLFAQVLTNEKSSVSL